MTVGRYFEKDTRVFLVISEPEREKERGKEEQTTELSPKDASLWSQGRSSGEQNMAVVCFNS